MSEIVSFGEWVQTRRNQLRLSRPELASQVHCSPVTIKKIERDERRPSSELAQLLATHLQVPEAEQADFVRRARGEFMPDMRSPAEMSLPQPPVDAANGQPPQHNLPQRLTSFIGREQEIETISTLVMEYRLVMLTGVGGIGKTNLSLQVGRSLLASFPDGVWFVEFAPIADRNLVARSVTAVFDLQESAEHAPIDLLREYLQDKKCLLILDNCEHLIDGVAQLASTLLSHCTDLKILASSREPLAVAGERPFPVPPLSLPQNQEQSILERWPQYEATRLFVERAQIVLPEYEVTADNVAPLVQICQRLDGIPLAIELAAARTKILTTAQIAERLDDRFRLLTSRSRDTLPRQQTLRALIDWSWELLSVDEQRLLSRLSIFAGGMDLEAVEAVCAGDDLETYELLDLLNELVNKSLVVAKREQGQETRYYLLETIRQYGQERLAEAGELELIQQRHLAYFLQLAETAEPGLRSHEQGMWLNRLEKELDNIRVALDWAQENDVEAGLRLIPALSWLLWVRGHGQEMENRLNQLLPQPSSASSQIKANATWWQGFLNLVQSQNLHPQAYTLFEECLAQFQALEDELGIARSLRFLGFILRQQGEFEEGQALLQESLALLRELGNEVEFADTLFWFAHGTSGQVRKQHYQECESIYRRVGDSIGLQASLNQLGTLAVGVGDYETARARLEESLAIGELLNLRDIVQTFSLLGILYYRLGEYAQAQTMLEKFLVMIKKPGTPWPDNFKWQLAHLGYVYLRQGELAQAKQKFIQSQQLLKKSNNIIGVVYSLEGLASFYVHREQPEKAVCLFAWTDVTRKAIHDTRPPVEQADVDQDLAIIRDMIDEQTFATVYAEGKMLTMDQAIALAIGDEE